jgi:deoxyribonuclease V
MMRMESLHPWTLDPAQAVQLQGELRQRIVLRWDGRPVNNVAGVDMSLTDEKAHAAIVILRFPDLTPLEGVTADAPLNFPYVPGLLSFREGPAILAAWAKLQHMPDLVMIDGQGIAHPRGIGIASHMGLWLQRPTIGVGKSKLYGTFAAPGPNAGDATDLIDPKTKGVIGAVLRSKARSNPLFISPGHLIDVQHAVDLVMQCLRGYRLPEPTRWAHNAAAGQPLPIENEDAGDQLSLL